MAKSLTENRRKQLDGIVERMINEGKSDKEIQTVVNDFKSIHSKGFVGNVARDITLPFKSSIQNLRATGDIARGESFLQATEPRIDPFVGPVSPVGVQGERQIQQMKARGIAPTARQQFSAFGRDVAGGIGAGFEIGSNLPVGAVIGKTAQIGSQVAKQGLKQYATRQGVRGLGRQALNMGIETGTASGLYTLGRGMQEQTPVGQLAKETAVSTGLGFGAGAVLGAGGAVVGTGLRQGFRGVRNIGTQTERLRGAIGTPSTKLEQSEIGRLEKDFETLFDEKKSTIKKNDILSRFGQTPARIFAESGYIPKIEGNKIRTDDFIDTADNFIIENAQSIQKVLDAYDEVNPRGALSYSDFRNRALKRIESNPDFAGKVTQLTNKLDEFLKDYKNAIKSDKLGFGQLNRLRVQSNINTKKYKFTDPEKALVDDLNSVVGDSVREIMTEKNISPTINQVNQEIGKLMKARNMASYINGNTVNGGALTNMLVSLGTGAVTAAVTGGQSAIVRGILSLVGAFGARQVLDTIRSLKFGGIIRKRILRNVGLNRELQEKLLKELPEIERQGILREIQDALRETPQLPSPKAGSPRSRIESGRTINLPARTQTSIAEQTKNMGQQKAFGAFVGIEQDEDGNITFNPEKAILGAVAMGTITSKQGDELISKLTDKVIKTAKSSTYDLTTKILKDLEGKTTVSKQYILDATNRGEIKQVERDITRQVLDTMPDGQINVKEFADKVKAELLPLKVKSSDMVNVKAKNQYSSNYLVKEGDFSSKYEWRALDNEIRGKVANYRENLYQSPIKTSADSAHFPYTAPNYFGHTRIEDMSDNKTRRVIEVQSDLYQKGNLEREFKTIPASERNGRKISEAIVAPDGTMHFDSPEFNKLKSDKNKLQQYNDPTAHFRMIREEIKKASQDGKTKLQFPTGETAMKIEGLGTQNNWRFVEIDDIPVNAGIDEAIKPEFLKIGLEVNDGAENWIITDVLGDGKFKAMPKNESYNWHYPDGSGTRSLSWEEATDAQKIDIVKDYSETFDISGKVDTNNPIYKFYEKEVSKYLNKFGGKRVVDDKGVSWIEIPIKKEWGNMPVEAFAFTPLAIQNKEDK